MSNDKKFYVYVHRYASGPKQGDIFYVGKGKGDRQYRRNGRNNKWLNYSSKYGYISEICHMEMKEDDAFLLEMWLIAKYRHLGYDLANMTDGGEGPTGIKWSIESRRKASNDIYCSNGMKFHSPINAQNWLKNELSISISHKTISKCARGDMSSAAGYSWSYDEIVPDYISKSDRLSIIVSKEVFCSNGMKFNSGKDAAIWLKECGIKNASQSGVSQCASGHRSSAYGYAWSYTGEFSNLISRREKQSISRSIPVNCSNGMAFYGISAAAEWLKNNGYPKASNSPIVSCCKGNRNTAYGFKWRYA